MTPQRSQFASPCGAAQRGTTMVEVLVTIVILAVGLLGLAGLEMRLQTSEMEAYQRAQALILLDDMANRLTTNRSNAASYVTATPLGQDACPTATATRQETDANQWCLALQGAAEVSSGNKVGALVGGRGCVEDLGNREYLITVAWQGLSPISAPPASVACGANDYDNGTTCTLDRCRRVVSTVVRIGTLS